MGDVIDFKSRDIVEKAKPEKKKFVKFECFFIQAIVSWISANNFHPHLHVQTNVQGVLVPEGFAGSNGMIKLNVSQHAVTNFKITEELITFDASFGGISHGVAIPPRAVVAVSDGLDSMFVVKENPE